MLIRNTSQEAAYPWPDTITLQGGRSGLVLRAAKDGGNYGTAFVEAFSPEGGFIRGEGATLSDAELAAWVKYQRNCSCPGHEWEARGYKNGAGFCKHCGKFECGVFTAEQLGCFCKICGVPTFWSRIDKDLYCEEHADDHDTRALKRRRLLEVTGNESVTGSQVSDLFERLSQRILDLDRKEDSDGLGSG